MAKGLTPKQRRFIDEYCVARRRAGASTGSMFNGTAAAIAAGYSPRSAREMASQNMTKPAIREAIEARLAELSKRSLMQADEVMERVSRIARSSITEAVRLEEGIVKVADTTEWPEGFEGCVQELSQDKDGVIEVKLDSKLKALELIGKYHKLWVEKHEIGGTDGKPIQFALPRMVDSEPADLPEESVGPGQEVRFVLPGKVKKSK